MEKKAKLEEERQGALRRKLKVDTENVTSMSNVIPIFGHRPTNQLTHGGSGNDPDMFLELKSDLVGPSFFGVYFSLLWALTDSFFSEQLKKLSR